MHAHLSLLRRGAVTLGVAGVVAGLAGPATAAAATIDMPGGSRAGDSEELVYQAAPGEDNFTVIREVPGTSPLEFTVKDVVPIEIVGEGEFDCFHVTTGDPTFVRCAPETDGYKRVRVGLFDGHNRLHSFSGAVPMVATGSGPGAVNHMDGGPGVDQLVGGDGDDTLIGGTGPDEVWALAGDDSVVGGTGDDVFHGGDGADTFIGGTGADRFEGEGGSDTVTYRDRLNPVKVTIDSGANDGEAGERDNVVPDVEAVVGGHASDDISDSSGGANTFIGGDGNDRLAGGAGADSTLAGGAGADVIDGGPGADMLFGGLGADDLKGGADNDLLQGEADLDTLDGGTGADNVSGGEGFDIVTYQSATQRVTADLDGAAGDDGATGEGDTLRTDLEQLVGGSASDTLTGNDAANLIIGGEGNDVLDGGLGADQLLGGNDSDTLRGKDGMADKLDCGADADQVDADSVDTKTGCESAAAPAVGIGPVTVKADKRGHARLQLHCWASSAGHCSGTVTINGRLDGQAVTVGRASLAIASGDTQNVRVRLSAAARRALADQGRLRVKARTWAKDATGTSWASGRTLKIVR